MKTMLILTLLLSFSNVFARCYNANEISRSAHELADEASRFDSVVDHMNGYSHLSSEIHKLEKETNHFNRSIERGSSCAHIIRDFRDVARKYQHLSNSLRRAHSIHRNHHVMDNFSNLQHSFQDLSSDIINLRNDGHH